VIVDELRAAHAVDMVALEIADHARRIILSATVEDAILKSLGDRDADQGYRIAATKYPEIGGIGHSMVVWLDFISPRPTSVRCE